MLRMGWVGGLALLTAISVAMGRRIRIPGIRGIPGTRTDYGCLSNFDGRPAFRGRRIRRTARPSRSTNMVFPNGRPVWPCSRKSRNSSSRVALFNNPDNRRPSPASEQHAPSGRRSRMNSGTK